jgi:predicted component of type VI protein secretion system
MDQQTEQQISKLATPLKQSAGAQYDMAVDFWLMAEQMVLEVMDATTKVAGLNVLQDVPQAEIDPPLPAVVPTERIRDLAHCMWESAGRQYGLALDFWLSAERHVLTMMRAASGTATPSTKDARSMAQEFATASAAAYLERIRETAYFLWEATGRQCDGALDDWLKAEKQVLEYMASAARVGNPFVKWDTSAPKDDGN